MEQTEPSVMDLYRTSADPQSCCFCSSTFCVYVRWEGNELGFSRVKHTAGESGELRLYCI